MAKAREEAVAEAAILIHGAMKKVVSPRWGSRHGIPRRSAVAKRTIVGGSVALGEPPTIDSSTLFKNVTFDVAPHGANVGVLGAVNYAEFVEGRNPFLERSVEEVEEEDVFKWLRGNFQ